jgi:voltage-gated potassium channel
MMNEIKEVIQRNRDLITLFWLIALILIFPYMEVVPFGQLIFVILITAFLLAALYSVSDRPSQVAVGLLLAVPTLLCSWTFVFIQTQRIWVALLLSMTVFFTYIVLAVLHRVITVRQVTLVELYRAIVIYIMISVIFGLMYLLLEILAPHSFQINAGPSDPQALFYFSFVALSTAGFGDITPVTPMSRSLVSIELLVGVMYMAVLIGLLVNAHYSARFSTPREAWKEEGGVGRIRRFRLPFISSGSPLAIIAIAVMLNMATSLVMIAFEFPLFMDTWGTSFAVIISGFGAGAVAGILYNILIAVGFQDLSAVAFTISSVFVAGLTWVFWKRGWVDVRAPWLLVGAGVITGILNALLTFSIVFLLHLPHYEGTVAINQFFTRQLGDTVAILMVENVIVEMIDKTFSLVLAAVAAILFTGLIERDMQKSEAGPPPSDGGKSLPDEK